jgi:hypothetical protein
MFLDLCKEKIPPNYDVQLLVEERVPAGFIPGGV